MRNFRMNPVTAAIGGVLVATLASASLADTDANPFGATDLAQGYMLLADNHGGAKEGEGKCGEGKCGEAAGDAKDAEGKCGEGKCGEGACGEASGEAKDAEGKCGEGKCGEGKCGESQS
jgi:uncharacterized low-complexity protein